MVRATGELQISIPKIRFDLIPIRGPSGQPPACGAAPHTNAANDVFRRDRPNDDRSNNGTGRPGEPDPGSHASRCRQRPPARRRPHRRERPPKSKSSRKHLDPVLFHLLADVNVDGRSEDTGTVDGMDWGDGPRIGTADWLSPSFPILNRAELWMWIGPREGDSRIAGGVVIRSALAAGVRRPVVWGAGPVPLSCAPVASAPFNIPQAAIPGPLWR